MTDTRSFAYDRGLIKKSMQFTMQKFLIDFFPLAAFLLLLLLKDIYWATGALMIGSVLQTTVHYVLHKRFEKMHLFGLAFVLPLGGLTLLLHDPAFIKWKVSIFFWVVAVIIAWRHWLLNKNTVRELMEFSVKISWPAPDALWKQMNLLWMWFAIITGVLNVLIAFVFFPGNNRIWGLFKFPGTFVIQMAVMIYTFVKLQPYLPAETSAENHSKD
ncbi:intracellular septation protein [Permianibacter aggregans]|uniref:Inner membrane-spanning protein YciB n=2 Tax=Permianibacter aggregans TaxID=1510150 RepID=A0A4R6UTX8_9GAMM|nr:intracellular septation protein [Permianibacter aggregans]